MVCLPCVVDTRVPECVLTKSILPNEPVFLCRARLVPSPGISAVEHDLTILDEVCRVLLSVNIQLDCHGPQSSGNDLAPLARRVVRLKAHHTWCVQTVRRWSFDLLGQRQSRVGRSISWASMAAARWGKSYPALYRWPLMKNAGVPLTPLRTPPMTSR